MPKNHPSEMVNYAMHLLAWAHDQQLPLALFGSLAISSATAQCHYLTHEAERVLKDIDFASLSPAQEPVNDWLCQKDWTRHEDIFAVSEGRRAIYGSAQFEFTMDIVFDELNCCHRMNLRGRLSPESDYIPLPDLLLSKLQRVELRPRDVEDIMALLACHGAELCASQGAALERINQVLSTDWGFYHTVETNLKSLKVLDERMPTEPYLNSDGISRASAVAEVLLTVLEQSQKNHMENSVVGRRSLAMVSSGRGNVSNLF